MSDLEKNIIFIFPDEIRLVFASYDEGMKGFDVARAALNLAKQQGIQGQVSVSFDNSSDNPTLTLKGPSTYTKAFYLMLDDMKVQYTIDVTEKEEQQDTTES
ncbi:MAG: hypothetical protein HZA34_02495 [Candidatus Pacebacteria bacterium]|nr:hypothetical protein [Candidatus Paceibacterota bacterium]